MAIEPKFAKPASAKVVINTVFGSSVGDQRAEGGKGDELVDHGLLAQETADRGGFAPWHSDQPRDRREDPAQQLLERQVLNSEPSSDAAQNAVG